MRKWLFVLVAIISFYLDNVFFNMFNVLGIRPDITLIISVSFGVLTGPMPAASTGLILGLITDIFFNKLVGPTALIYMLSGLAGGFFYRKFYADNIIIPAATAAVSFFVKEHVFLIIAKIAGARPPYFVTLVSYIIPSTLVTAAFCALIHIILKRHLFHPLWRKEAIDLD